MFKGKSKILEIVKEVCVKWHGSCGGCSSFDEPVNECSFLRDVKLRLEGKKVYGIE